MSTGEQTNTKKQEAMKTYIKPQMETGNVSECEMLAASLPIGEGTVDGGEALVKKNEWDIFGDEDADEE